MILDFNSIVSGLLAVLWGVLAWNFQRLQSKADVTEKDLQAYKTLVATTYVTDGQLTKALDALNNNIKTVLQTVNKIEERLYTKEQQHN